MTGSRPSMCCHIEVSGGSWSPPLAAVERVGLRSWLRGSRYSLPGLEDCRGTPQYNITSKRCSTFVTLANTAKATVAGFKATSSTCSVTKASVGNLLLMMTRLDCFLWYMYLSGSKVLRGYMKVIHTSPCDRKRKGQEVKRSANYFNYWSTSMHGAYTSELLHCHKNSLSLFALHTLPSTRELSQLMSSQAAVPYPTPLYLQCSHHLVPALSQSALGNLHPRLALRSSWYLMLMQHLSGLPPMTQQVVIH